MQGNTILLKQDNGSYQLLRISTQPGSTTPGLTPTGGNTIRLQTVPAVSSRFPSGPGPTTLALRKTILTQQVKQKNVNSHHHHVCFYSILYIPHFYYYILTLFWWWFQCFFSRFSQVYIFFDTKLCRRYICFQWFHISMIQLWHNFIISRKDRSIRCKVKFLLLYQLLK